MLRAFVRRLLVALTATALAAATTLVVSAGPAHAAVAGNLLSKGAGSLYSDWGSLNLGAVPGGSPATFFHKVVNTGSTSAQFKVVLDQAHSSSQATIYAGSTAVGKRYFTPPIPPGGSVVVKVVAYVFHGTPQSSGYLLMMLQDPQTQTTLDYVFDNVHITPQAGNMRNDLFLKTGTQPYVGGSFSGQYETSQALKVGNTATFLLRLQNNGTSPAAIGLSGGSTGYCPSTFAITVKQGTTNVTAAVVGGTYTTGTLAVGAVRSLTVSFKLKSATTCGAAFSSFTASGPDPSVTVTAHVLVAA